MAKASGSGGQFFGVECDLDKDEDIRAMFDWIRQHPDLGQVDVCICNAGNEGLISRSWISIAYFTERPEKT